MRFSDAIQIHDIISQVSQDLGLRKMGSQSRIEVYNQLTNPIKKLAFDTRRIDQENDRNPRRNLQYYHRSQPFIDDELSGKIAHMMKVKNATDLIKEQYGSDPEWFDSYARILSSAVDRALRTEQKDGDFFKASFNYLDELLYVRYRISNEDLTKMSERDIERVILGKDEIMVHKHLFKTTVKKEEPIAKYTAVSMPPPPTDPLVERLLDGVKANAETKDVERTISITVRDKINDPPVKIG